MNVSLSAELENFVNDRVKSGSFQSASDVIAEALRQFKENDEIDPARLEELRKQIDVGLEELERGECEPLDMGKIKAEARALWNAQRKA